LGEGGKEGFLVDSNALSVRPILKILEMNKIYLLVLSFCFGSCGLMIHGTKQNVRFNCKQDAEVKLNLDVLGRTNQLLTIPRKNLDGLVRISAEGCETKEMMLPLKNTLGSWLDVPWVFFPYGSIFLHLDMMYDSDIATENEINVELNCKN
jgi:hypothetical protein